MYSASLKKESKRNLYLNICQKEKSSFDVKVHLFKLRFTLLIERDPLKHRRDRCSQKGK